ncbi:translocation/assembly module TamB domain-containing protein [Gymnodinialimonas hymeniacidonis]|uniref:translocation/assembly module TamB domain-containing protein n=1 Tax=Gymnodinialimonas hymeniacidonis TaxID=3126508 RepID=UPI0034C5F0D1
MRWLCILLLLLLPTAAVAQDDDRSRLIRFLEDQLSDGAARQIRIEGFRGALSSEAQLDELTISDADGVWLTLENATLNWSRSALLTGALQIDALTADRLEILRPPLADEGVDLADTEATPFALPELPVSIEIGRFAIAEVVLGEPIIGLPATLSVEGSGQLIGGAGQADIALERLDGPGGTFALQAEYDNTSRDLALSLLLAEPEEGLTAELLGLPGRPDLSLSIEGEGPITDFASQITLQTEGQDRIAGQVITSTGTDGDQLLTVDIGGDIRPLLLPDFRDFFGADTRVQAQARQEPDGGLSLDALRLSSAALSLEGSVALSPGGLPEIVDLTGQITPPQGERVRLPSGGTPTEIAGADLSVTYDRAAGDAYALIIGLDRLTVEDLAVQNGQLRFEGTAAITETGIEATAAELSAALSGVQHTDPAVAQALGERISLDATLSWIAGAPLILSDLVAQSGDVTATGGASLQTGENRLDVAMDVTATVADLSRFAAVAGQPLDGAATLGLAGGIEPLSGAFDLAISGTGTDLRFVDAVPAEIFAGDTQLAANVVRNETGLTLTGLNLENAELDLTGEASLTSGDTVASAEFELREVGYFTDFLSGPVAITAEVARQGTAPFDIDVALTGPNEIAANTQGTFDADTGDFALDLTASATGLDIGNGVPPQLLAGRTQITATANRTGDVLSLTDLSVRNPELTLTGEASVSPTVSRVDVDARLANVGLFTDALSGPVSADAILTRQGEDPWQVNADLGGPGGMNANVAGRVGLPNNAVDLRLNGQAPLALANRYIQPRSIRGTLGFNLSMQGAPGLSALSGTLSSNNARIAVPTYALAVENIGLNAQISGGRVNLTGNGTLSTGGQLSTQGSINLGSPGLDGQINVSLVNGRIVDPTLYDAQIARADLSVSGPLARGPRISGDITLGESEIRVPEASLAGSAAIPDIRHLGETPEERLTRRFAGLLGSSAGSSGGGSATTALDINITAPGRIFLRGRGIDAEFGGSIRLFGTTANVIPTGQFELVRGRLSILGTRLDFVEGQATLQGSFDPFLRLAAVSRASGYQITIRVDGAASNPEITFASDPSLPEDEVLAQLLFGRSVSGLSPLQLLQLADAATSLAGGSTNSGFIAGLRDGLGLDDLDLSTDDEGNAAVTAGRYLSENIYTDVTINAEGDADLSLNIDLTPNFTARGSVGSDGSSSIGIFFEQDY